MLRNRLEEMVWAVTFVKILYKGKRMEFASEAAEYADRSVLALRHHTLTNMDRPGTIHVVDMMEYLNPEDPSELKYDLMEAEDE